MDYLSLDSKSLARLFVEDPKSLTASMRAWIEISEFTGKRTKDWFDKLHNGLVLIDEAVKLAKDFSPHIEKFSKEAPKLAYWLNRDDFHGSPDEDEQWDRDLGRYLKFFDTYLDFRNLPQETATEINQKKIVRKSYASGTQKKNSGKNNHAWDANAKRMATRYIAACKRAGKKLKRPDFIAEELTSNAGDFPNAREASTINQSLKIHLQEWKPRLDKALGKTTDVE